MKNNILKVIALAVLSFSISAVGQQPRFRVLAFYSTDVEADHVEFARQAVDFFTKTAARDQFAFTATTNWDELNAPDLSKYQVVIWLDDSPHTPAQRRSFEQYMDHGGGWLGFHAAGYNDESTHWPWFVEFLGSVFYGNSWPPLAARISVDDKSDPITSRLPASFMAPANEWYSWKPDPRASGQIKVLATLDPSNYPIGLKDTLTGGDIPVAWSNTKYKMVYMNMGHGDKIFDSVTQNLFFEDALLRLGSGR